MDGRAIPGFYYDSERKKYFKIQPNHVAPEGSKYSKENVLKEQEKTRKRKRDALLNEKRLEQTISRAPILRSHHSQTTIGREGGLQPGPATSRARTAAFASQLQQSDIVDVKSCETCGRKDLVFDFAIDPATDGLVWGLGSANSSRLEYLTDSSAAYDLAAFNSETSSINITSSRTLVATSLRCGYPGNVFVARLSEESDEAGYPLLDSAAPSYSKIGNEYTTIWTSSPNPPGRNADLIALGGSDRTYVISVDGRLLQSYSSGSDVRAVDWLSPDVAVGGTLGRSVFLWDTRTWGSSVRFHHTSGVNGLRSLGNGSQVLVQGFDGMAIYDVRMTGPTASAGSRPMKQRAASQALLRIPHETRTPQVAMDLWPAVQLVAARDDNNVVKLYSLTDGKAVSTLGKPDEGRDRQWIRRLRFVEDKEGRPALMACQGAGVYEWVYGGLYDDEG